MSPDMKLDFEGEWGELQKRLRRFLFRKKIPAVRHDDLVQETALRLLLMWSQVDRSRSPWPLTVTIATNLLRDEIRVRPVREVVGDLPERAAEVDVERSGLARVELERVRVAMARLTASQRAALLQEIGAISSNGNTGDATKMLRHRARRKLSSMIRDVSAVAVLRLRRLLEMIQGVLPTYEGLLPTGACVVCVLLGLSGGMVLEVSTPAEAHQVRGLLRSETDSAPSVGSSFATLPAPEGVDVATSAKPDVVAAPVASSKARTAVPSSTDGVASPNLLPSGDDTPVPVPRTPPIPEPGDQPADVQADADVPEPPQPPSQEDGPIQAPVPLPDAVTDPLGAVGDL